MKSVCYRHFNVNFNKVANPYQTTKYLEFSHEKFKVFCHLIRIGNFIKVYVKVTVIFHMKNSRYFVVW